MDSPLFFSAGVGTMMRWRRIIGQRGEPPQTHLPPMPAMAPCFYGGKCQSVTRRSTASYGAHFLLGYRCCPLGLRHFILQRGPRGETERYVNGSTCGRWQTTSLHLLCLHFFAAVRSAWGESALFARWALAISTRPRPSQRSRQFFPSSWSPPNFSTSPPSFFLSSRFFSILTSPPPFPPFALPFLHFSASRAVSFRSIKASSLSSKILVSLFRSRTRNRPSVSIQSTFQKSSTSPTTIQQRFIR